MGYIKDVQIGNNTHLIEPILYAITSGTASAITAQIANFDLQSGVVITLKITTSNSANATLNVSSTGSKPIKYNNTTIQAGLLKQNKIYSFVYDGTDDNDTGAWLLIGEINTETSTPMHFLGTVTSLSERSSAIIDIGNNQQVTASIGDVILYNTQELIWDGTEWVLFGDESSYAVKTEIIGKNIFDDAGQLIYSSASNTPAILDIPSNFTNKTYVLKINNGLPSWEEEYSYTLPTATSNDLGGIKITNSSQNEVSNRNYNISLDNLQYAYVNVPWTDTLYGVAANGGLTITDTPDGQTGKYLLAHSNTLLAGNSNVGIANNSSGTVLNFGDSFYIPQISYDIHGHITAITDTTLTLPGISDEKVKQTPTSSETQTQWRRLLLGYSNASNLEVTMNEVTNQAYFYQSLAADAKTGTLRANRYRVLDNVEVEWNSNDASLDFIFI